jgi:hypothetical protein
MSYNNTYSVYNIVELNEKLNSFQNINNDVDTFFKNFNFETNILNNQMAKGNSSQVFNKIIKEDTTKAKIINYLNKLSQNNLSKIVNMIREIVFQTTDELNELVYQCIKKIKLEKDEIRPLVAALCWEFMTLYFVTSDNEKIYFRKLLLTEVKKEYLSSISFDSNEWAKEKADKVMILIGTFYNGKIIEEKIMSSILNDLKNNITYKQDETQEYYDRVEKSIQLLSCLVSSIVLNTDSKLMFGELDKFLQTQIVEYEEAKCISKKIRLVAKNIIYELTK